MPLLTLSTAPGLASPLLGRLQRAWTGRPWTMGAAPVYAWPHSLDPRADATYRPVVNPLRSLPAATAGQIQPSPANAAGSAQITTVPVLQAGLRHVLQRSQPPLAALLAASAEALPGRGASSGPPAATEHHAARSLDSAAPIVSARRVSGDPTPHLPPALSESPASPQASPDPPAHSTGEPSHAKEPAPPVKLGRVIQRRHTGARVAPAGGPADALPDVPIDPAHVHPIHRYPDTAGHLPASGGHPPEPGVKADGPVAGHLPESLAHGSRPSAAPYRGKRPCPPRTPDRTPNSTPQRPGQLHSRLQLRVRSRACRSRIPPEPAGQRSRRLRNRATRIRWFMP